MPIAAAISVIGLLCITVELTSSFFSVCIFSPRVLPDEKRSARIAFDCSWDFCVGAGCASGAFSVMPFVSIIISACSTLAGSSAGRLVVTCSVFSGSVAMGGAACVFFSSAWVSEGNNLTMSAALLTRDLASSISALSDPDKSESCSSNVNASSRSLPIMLTAFRKSISLCFFNYYRFLYFAKVINNSFSDPI